MNTHAQGHVCYSPPCVPVLTHTSETHGQWWTRDCTTTNPHLTSATHAPTALTTPQYSRQLTILCPRHTLRSPSSQRPLFPPGCVPVLAYPELSPACSDLLRRCPAVALAPAFLAWCSWSVPCHPARHGAASQRLRNQVRVAQWESSTLQQLPPLPASVSAAWVAKNKSPHQVLHGHGDPLWGNPLAHGSQTCQVLTDTEVPYTG